MAMGNSEFEDRIRLDERELCAKLAEQTVTRTRLVSYNEPDTYEETVPKWENGAEIAAAIRGQR